MFPILFEFQGIEFSSLMVSLILGFMAFTGMILYLAPLKGLNIKFWNTLILPLTIAALVGGRIIFVITHLESFQDNWKNIFLFDGFSFWGGIIFGMIIIYVIAQRKKEDFLSWLDLLTTAFFAFLFFSAIGHFLDGSNYGFPTTLPWGVTFDNILAPVAYTVPIHPTQIYQALYCILFFFVLLYLYQKIPFKGIITCIGGALLGISDFILGFFLGDETLFIMNLRLEQWLALFAFIICGSLLFTFLLKKHEL